MGKVTVDYNGGLTGGKSLAKWKEDQAET